MDIEPTTCNGHLPYPWGWCWREERVELDAGVGRGGGGRWSKIPRRGNGPNFSSS